MNKDEEQKIWNRVCRRILACDQVGKRGILRWLTTGRRTHSGGRDKFEDLVPKIAEWLDSFDPNPVATAKNEVEETIEEESQGHDEVDNDWGNQ